MKISIKRDPFELEVEKDMEIATVCRIGGGAVEIQFVGLPDVRIELSYHEQGTLAMKLLDAFARTHDRPLR